MDNVDKSIAKIFSKLEGDDVLDKSIIKDKLTGKKPSQNKRTSKRAERRAFLNYYTKYFYTKNHMSLDNWRELVQANIKQGNDKHNTFVETVNKKQIEELSKKEGIYREFLKSQNKPNNVIEELVEKWYDRVIKNGSSLMIK